MWWYDRPEPRGWRTIYVYLKTRIAVEFASEAIDTLAENWRYRTNLLRIGPEGMWEDGFVLRVTAQMDAPDFAQEQSETLRGFESWVIHDDKGNFVESQNGGPVSRFFDLLSDKDQPTNRFSQLFIVCNPNNPWSEKTINEIRSSLRGPLAPVFFFRGGQILLLGSQESGKITNQRCGRYLRGLTGWRVTDSNQETFSADGQDEDCWNWRAFFDFVSNE